ncbi:MAG: LytTR family DNA-binding domain-containing protein [Marinoscillum sp.]
MSESFINVVLVDDEQHGLDMLRWSLEQYCPEVRIVESLSDPGEALLYLQSNQPDILFLDIEMPGMNGFELLGAIDDIHFAIVFTTAYDEFAIRAFKVSAFDYLLKPIEQLELVSVIRKYLSKKKENGLEPQLSLLKQLIHQPSKLTRVALPTFEGLEMIQVDQVVRCEADNNYTHIILETGRKILVSKTLKDIADLLKDHRFHRVHYSHMINLNKIQRYVKGDGGYVIMDDGASVNVSRSKKESFLKALNA